MSYRMPDHFVCPECGNEDLQIVTETNVTTSGKDFSAGKGCLGFLLLGPLGLLCGACGQGQKVNTTNTTSYMCPKCGAKFENPKDLEKSIEIRNGIVKKLLYVLAGMFFVGAAISLIAAFTLYNRFGGFVFSHYSKEIMPLLISPIFDICLGLLMLRTGKRSAANAQNKYDELARKMNYFIDKKKLENKDKNESDV